MKRTATAASPVLFVFLGCVLGAVVGTHLTFPGVGAAVAFPPYAVLTAALWRTPPRGWWLLLLAASIGNFLPHHRSGAGLAFILSAEAANHLRAAIAAVGLRRFAPRPARFETLPEMVAYLAFAVGLAPAAGGLVGAAVVTWHHAAYPFWLVWHEWTLSNALTALTLLPLLMIEPRAILGGAQVPARRAIEATLLGLGLLASGAGAFLSSYGSTSVYAARLYGPLPFLLWAAARFGPRGTSAALLAVGSLATWGALHRQGPFASPSPAEDLLELQVFLLASCVPLLLLASLLAQQRATASALARAEAERERLQAQRSVEEALRETARRKDEFIAMLGHELRNPLASIAMALEIVRRAPGEPAAEWAQDAAGRQLKLITRLVDDMLDVSRISEGKIRLQTAPADLVSIVANAVEITRPLILSLGHQLLVQVPREPMFVRADGVRLTQAVANLLNNAAKFTDAGGRIELSLRRDADGARIVVRDSGIGIAPQALETIFEMFTQVPRARSVVAGGLGVGLTLVKRLVELHGGSVRAASAGEGHGSEFEIRLPLPEAQPRAEAGATAEPSGLRLTRHVLIADDNTDAAEGLRFILQRQSHVVEVVHDGAQALDAVSRGNPDVVLLDIGLPGMNGLEVARLVRQRHGAKRPLLVAMTGLGQPDDLRRSASAGFDHHLVKPIDLTQLEALLATE